MSSASNNCGNSTQLLSLLMQQGIARAASEKTDDPDLKVPFETLQERAASEKTDDPDLKFLFETLQERDASHIPVLKEASKIRDWMKTNQPDLNRYFYLTLSQPITTLPSEIRLLNNLKFLKLSGCQLRRVPEEIDSLEQLEFLDLSHNKLTDFPPFKSLGKLEILNLSSNPELCLPVSIEEFRKTIPHLRVLNLRFTSHNKFHEYPPVNVDQPK